jgi:hypothetical protein
MKDGTAINTNGDAQEFDPQRVSDALDKVIKNRLKSGPVTIRDDRNTYRITGAERGYFRCETLDPSGEVLAGGLHQLPIDDYYLPLVLPALNWELASAAIV